MTTYNIFTVFIWDYRLSRAATVKQLLINHDVFTLRDVEAVCVKTQLSHDAWRDGSTPKYREIISKSNYFSNTCLLIYRLVPQTQSRMWVERGHT